MTRAYEIKVHGLDKSNLDTKQNQRNKGSLFLITGKGGSKLMDGKELHKACVMSEARALKRSIHF